MIKPDPKTTAQNYRRQALLLAFGAFALLLVVWQLGALDSILFPLRLYVSLIHEMGHGLTAIVTGGTFVRFEVFPNGAGLAYTAGGSPFLVPQMGYLGAALFGAILLVLTNRIASGDNVRWVAYGVALLIGGCAILFTSTTGAILPILIAGAVAWLIAPSAPARFLTPLRLLAAVFAVVVLVMVWTNVALRLGVIGAVLLAALGGFAPRAVIVFVLNFLALTIGLNAMTDIFILFSAPTASVGSIPNDAAAMAAYTGIPTLVWVLLWVVLSGAMIGAALYVSFIQSIRRKPTNSASP